MSNFEVPNPILNSPFEEPRTHWFIREGEAPMQREGRRPGIVFRPSEQRVEWDLSDGTLARSEDYPAGYAMQLVNRIRERMTAWRNDGRPGVTRTTYDLLEWWTREGRKQRLFFAQLEAAETAIFLTEARSDFLQGLQVPRDLPPGQNDSRGGTGFLRYALKLATGSGKTTVMAMLTAWSILNKAQNRGDKRFSDVVLVICPNVTIRNRLQELDPDHGDASLYRTRDIVPENLMPTLGQGRVIVTNWHVFAPKTANVAGETARVLKTGVRETREETIHIGQRNESARQKRYLTPEALDIQLVSGALTLVPGSEERDADGRLVKVKVVSERYVESDAALLQRVLGRDVVGKQNLLVLNDEAHHAYRVRQEAEDPDMFGDDEGEEEEQFFEEATVWVEGLDRVNARCGINLCVDLSATPYFLGRVGQETNRPFPWTVSDFGLIDAIESGLVKIPQLAVRDTTGQEVAGFFNIWKWVLDRLTPAERGGRRGSPKPEAVLKHAALPISQLAGLWEKECETWVEQNESRTPVFIVVCKNTRIAKVIFEWLAEGRTPPGLAPSRIENFKNNGRINTIRVDTKVAHETDSDAAVDDEKRWMRFTLDTVGRTEWPRDKQGRAIYPEGFPELAEKLERSLHPPGRDVRCIVSVAMLTEGWDCNTVTHIIGLRPFQSQLLCEQVVGRGLRRRRYDAGEDELFSEEVAKVFGVPFEVIPFKETDGPTPPTPKRHHVHAIPQKAQHEIRFPRVTGYGQAVRNRIAMAWDRMPLTKLDPQQIPAETQVKGLSISTEGRMSFFGPGSVDRVRLVEFRRKLRLAQVQFQIAADLTRVLIQENACAVPPHRLFPQALQIVERCFSNHIVALAPFAPVDAWHSPFYGQILERLRLCIEPDTVQGEPPEIPLYERNREPGSTTDVSYWTSKEVWPVEHSHLNYVVADTKVFEQSLAYTLDSHPMVRDFVKNAGLGFAIPAFYGGQQHDYVPDFIVRLKTEREAFLILEGKGFPDGFAEDKTAAARRWVKAINADGHFGLWHYEVVRHQSAVSQAIANALDAVRAAVAADRVTAWLVTQLGQECWQQRGPLLGTWLWHAPGHEVDLGELNHIAERLRTSPDQVRLALEVLSSPEKSLVDRRFLRVSESGEPRLLDPEEVLSTARKHYIEHALTAEEWATWSRDVRVVWKMIPGEEI